MEPRSEGELSSRAGSRGSSNSSSTERSSVRGDLDLGRVAFRSATQSDVVVVLDTTTLAVKDLIQAGQEPDGMALARN